MKTWEKWFISFEMFCIIPLFLTVFFLNLAILWLLIGGIGTIISATQMVFSVEAKKTS